MKQFEILRQHIKQIEKMVMFLSGEIDGIIAGNTASEKVTSDIFKAIPKNNVINVSGGSYENREQ